MLSSVKKKMPRNVIRFLRRCYFIHLNTLDKIKGKKTLIPPESFIFTGSGDYTKIGNTYKQYFIDLCNLQKNDRVLDVGCGIGRMAVPLTDFLSKNGEYWGFDIVDKGIDWCKTYISSRYKNFHFFLSDIYNSHYNKKGKYQAKDYFFPLKDNYFNLIFLTSVFTHMYQQDLEHYLSEISRVLQTNGKVLITFFILNNESINLMTNKNSTYNFKYPVNDICNCFNNNDPEIGLAYREDYLKKLFSKFNLKIIEPIHYGSWCGREKFLNFQDIIIAEKK